MKLILLFTSLFSFGLSDIKESPNDYDNKLSDIVIKFKAGIMDKEVCENQKKTANDLTNEIDDAIKEAYTADEISKLKKTQKRG